MDFRSKLKKYIPGNKDREFRKQVQEEKRQKYLFSDGDESEKFHATRNSQGWLKKKKKNRPSSFSNIITRKYASVKTFFHDSTILFAL